MIHVKVTMLPTEFSVDQDSLDPILIDNGSVQCVIQVKGFVFCVLYLVFCILMVNSVQCFRRQYFVFFLWNLFLSSYLECWYQINFPGMMLQSRWREERESFFVAKTEIQLNWTIFISASKQSFFAAFVKWYMENWLELASFWRSELYLRIISISVQPLRKLGKLIKIGMIFMMIFMMIILAKWSQSQLAELYLRMVPISWQLS